jgi:hypothetical protein
MAKYIDHLEVFVQYMCIGGVNQTFIYDVVWELRDSFFRQLFCETNESCAGKFFVSFFLKL